MRAIVIEESLDAGARRALLGAVGSRVYAHDLDGRAVTIHELEIESDSAWDFALALSRGLSAGRSYGHLVDDERMFVAFPGCVAEILRGDAEAARRARDIGRIFSVPIEQMPFLEMFDNDHPDKER